MCLGMEHVPRETDMCLLGSQCASQKTAAADSQAPRWHLSGAIHRPATRNMNVNTEVYTSEDTGGILYIALAIMTGGIDRAGKCFTILPWCRECCLMIVCMQRDKTFFLPQWMTKANNHCYVLVVHLLKWASANSLIKLHKARHGYQLYGTNDSGMSCDLQHAQIEKVHWKRWLCVYIKPNLCPPQWPISPSNLDTRL